MKKYVMLGIWMIAATLLAAQPRSRDAHQHSGRNVQKMKVELSLDEQQFASIKMINEKYAGKHAVLRRDSTMDGKQRFTEIRALKVEREREVDAVLTPHQKTKWTAFKEARAEKMKARKIERQAKHAEHLKDVLSLTEEQQIKMNAENKDFFGKTGQIWKNDSLEESAKRAEIRKLKASHEEALKSFLSEEQFKKLKALRTARSSGHRSKLR